MLRDPSRTSLKDTNWWDSRSDLTRWQLKVCEGRQTWHYQKDEEAFQPSFCEHYHLGQLTEKHTKDMGLLERSLKIRKHKNPLYDIMNEALFLGLKFFKHTQTEDGHFAGDYSGPMFLLPGFIIILYVTGILDEVFSIQHRKEMVHYLKTHLKEEKSLSSHNAATNSHKTTIEDKTDPSGWGLHIEGPPTMFGTCLNYVALRLIGVPSTESFMQRARSFIYRHGGAEYIPSWGKFYLTVLNLYEWEGVTPILPELWMLPDWFPIHPSKMWCHCRQVYLPMSYIYGLKWKAPLDPLLLKLRKEIYCRSYETIDWPSCQFRVASIDSYAPAGKICKSVFFLLNMFEKWVFPASLRNMALQKTIDHVKADDQYTQCISIGPVSKILNMLAIYLHEGPTSNSFRNHVTRVLDYIWMGADGLKVQGTNGSQLWDTSLFVQAIYETGKLKLQYIE
jgi:lanosterol synthase